MVPAIVFTTKSSAQIQSNKFSEYKNAVVETKAEKSNECGSATGLTLSWKNVSNEKMDLQYAIERRDGTWYVRSVENVAPGETVPLKAFCKASGKHVWWARPSSKISEKPFPALDEIKNAQY